MSIRDNFHYGWVVVVVAAIAMCFVYGLRHTFGVFFPPILREFGWSRASTAGIFSITVLTYGVIAIFSGTLGARFNPKLLMSLGLVFTCSVSAVCALASELWHFYIIYGVLVPVGMSFCGWPLLVPGVANWFSRRRGTAIALAQAGSGFSYTLGLIVDPVISSYGWRWAYVFQAVLVLVLVLPLYLFFFRYRPGPADKIETSRVTSTGPKTPAADWTLAGVLKSRHIWLLVISFFLYQGFSMYLLLTHQVQFAIDQGYSSIMAASFFAMFGFMTVVGMMCSSISDLIGREKCASIACGISILSTAALLMVQGTESPWLMYIYSLGVGFGSGLITPAVFAAAADIYAGAYYGTATGMVLLGLGIGGALGPWLGGLIYDMTGTYRMAFLLTLICQLVALLAFYLAAPRKAKEFRAKLSLKQASQEG